MLAHEPLAAIIQRCGNLSALGREAHSRGCNCTAAEAAASAIQIGRQPVYLPWWMSWAQPRPAAATAAGWWYSFPTAGACPTAKSTGTTATAGGGGCTWRRHATARIFYST